ncbi:hypothetical protein ABIE67_010005 [Streptomyces sp. V4I8]|uniref:hypothetical protein n=1 Tax=Streptomyces sp. V4I8 TaxID=3156469 RepID=UPI003516F188
MPGLVVILGAEFPAATGGDMTVFGTAAVSPASARSPRPHEFMAPGVAVTVGHIMKEGCFRPAMIQLL